MDPTQDQKDYQDYKEYLEYQKHIAKPEPQAGPAPSPVKPGEGLTSDDYRNSIGRGIKEVAPFAVGAGPGGVALKMLLGAAAGAGGEAIKAEGDPGDSVAWSGVKGAAAQVPLPSLGAVKAIGGLGLKEAGSRTVRALEAIPGATAVKNIYNAVKGTPAVNASSGARELAGPSRLERLFKGSPELEAIPAGVAPRARPVPAEPVPVEAPVSLEPIPQGPAPRTGSAPREVPVESPVLTGESQFGVSRSAPEAFTPASTVKTEPMTLAEALSLNAPTLSKAGKAPIGKPANLPREAMSMDKVPPMSSGESLMDYFNRINRVGSDIIAPIKK